MNATTVAVDLAKNGFELAVADEHWRVEVRGGHSLAWWAHHHPGLVQCEGCIVMFRDAGTFTSLGRGRHAPEYWY